MKKTLAALLAFCLVFALTACSGTENEQNEQKSQQVGDQTSGKLEEPSKEVPVETLETIKIGHIVDLTGVEASTGMIAQKSLEFAVKAIGGEIAGHPIEIVLGDAQSSSATAVDLARKMVESDGVVAIFGPTQIGHKNAVAEYIATAEIPLIFYNGTPLNTLKSNDWVVGAGGATPQMPSTMAVYCYDELGYRSVNILSMDNLGYRSYINPFIEEFTALGGEVVSEQWAPIPCADWAPYQSGIKDADATIAWASGSDAISLWQAWTDTGLVDKMPLVAAMHGGFTDYFVPTALANVNTAALENMLGAVAPIMWVGDIDTPENNELMAKWEEEYGEKPVGSNLPGACYQSILLFKAALEATGGETDSQLLIDAIFAADVTGPEGHLYFADGSHAATKDVHIVEVVQLEDGSYNYSLLKTYEDVPPEGYGK